MRKIGRITGDEMSNTTLLNSAEMLDGVLKIEKRGLQGSRDGKSVDGSQGKEFGEVGQDLPHVGAWNNFTNYVSDVA